MLRIIAAISAFQVMAVLVNIVRSKLLAVLLGPQGVGAISIVDQTVQLVTQLTAFSLPFASIKFLSRSHSMGFEAFRKTFSSFFRALVLLTTLGACISLGILFLRPEMLGSELTPYRPFLTPAILSIPAITLHGFFVSVLAAAQKARASAGMVLVIATMLVISAIVGITLGGIAGLYWSNLIANYLVVVGVLLYLKLFLQISPFEGGHSIRNELRENPHILTFSLVLYVASLTLPLSLFVARYSLLKHFGEAEVGLLQSAIGVSFAINLLLNPANGLYLTPILNRAITAGEKMQATIEFQRKLMLPLLAVGMPIVFFAPQLLILLYSPSFIAVSSILFLFVIYQYINQLAGVYQALLIGLDKLKIYAILVGIGQLSLGAVAWLLAPYFGIVGVAAGFLFSATTILILSHAQLKINQGLVISVKQMLLMIYGFSALFLAGIISNRLEATDLWAMIGKVGFYALFMISLLLFLNREEMHFLIHKSAAIRARAGQIGWKHIE